LEAYVVLLTIKENAMRSVSAREANQQFSRILGEAANGEEIVITRRGKPVAVLAPYRQARLTPEQEAAIEELVQMMKRGIGKGARRFSRDEMHER
jgi:prevent-host-death family protein